MELEDVFPWKLTNVPWKSMVGSDVFPTEIVPFVGDEFVSFPGCSSLPACELELVELAALAWRKRGGWGWVGQEQKDMNGKQG